jgi:mannosyltransferase OCH1-like enzyme
MIPRVVHRLWLGDPEPEWQRPFADTWRRPGWELVEWDELAVEKLRPLANEHIYARAERLCPDHVGQLRADILRLEILERFGGVWVDADLECLRPLDELLEGTSAFLAWEVQDRWLNTALMGAMREHPFIRRLIRSLPTSMKRHRGAPPRKVSGPQYVTRQWRRYGHGVRVLDQRLVYPYGHREIAAHGPGEQWAEAYTVHHWANQRRERSVPVD